MTLPIFLDFNVLKTSYISVDFLFSSRWWSGGWPSAKWVAIWFCGFMICIIYQFKGKSVEETSTELKHFWAWFQVNPFIYNSKYVSSSHHLWYVNFSEDLFPKRKCGSISNYFLVITWCSYLYDVSTLRSGPRDRAAGKILCTVSALPRILAVLNAHCSWLAFLLHLLFWVFFFLSFFLKSPSKRLHLFL